MIRTLIAVLSALFFSLAAHGQDELEQRLQSFRSDPRDFLDALPEKTHSGGKHSLPLFTAGDVASRNFVTAKNSRRQALRGRSKIRNNDLAEDLVDNADQMVTTLEAMDEKGLTEGEVSVQPWSDSYWPLYNGQIAFRYADPAFPADSKSWKKKSDYLNSDEALASGVELLSPAEKYDLLVGDPARSLTKSALDAGGSYYENDRKVEAWMGICDGWSPAAFMIDRPTHAVSAMAADGKTELTFYPSDIKALSSLLWAENSPEVKFIGGRCDEKKPEKDENGRIKNQNCFDTNPGTWHQAVVNQIGVNKRAFIMDSTYDYEVWNQPVKGYSYRYFNPLTLRAKKNLSDATVSIDEMTDDKFAAYRSKKTKFIVGISMKVDYIEETDPSKAATDGPENDEITQVKYEYDLELDKDGKIIGGEWYKNAHPDFLWSPAPGDQALTPADDLLNENDDGGKSWSGTRAMPLSWSEAAPRASRKGSPLATIVKALVNLSRQSR